MFYPEDYRQIKQAIIDYWKPVADIDKSQIQLDAGSVNLLVNFNRLFISKASKVLGYQPQFTDYISLLEVEGGEYLKIDLDPASHFKFDVKRFLVEKGEGKNE